ncbi:transposase [Streptomyces sp. NPDC017964]|uniref:transposase n=1 Tax=Streptomyces sp. NPDC017964 TaxID=3365022 RepID=UPI0037970F17
MDFPTESFRAERNRLLQSRAAGWNSPPGRIAVLRPAGLNVTCGDLPGADDAAVFTLRPLARRIQQLTAEVKELTCRVANAVRRCRRELLDIDGVGPDSAAALLIAVGDNPERLAGEASFAALCGVSPVAQSYGKRHGSRRRRPPTYGRGARGAGGTERNKRSPPDPGIWNQAVTVPGTHSMLRLGNTLWVALPLFLRRLAAPNRHGPVHR